MDIIQPFLLSDGLVRGRLIAADQTIDDILKKKDFPKILNSLVAQSILLALALSSGLKYDGTFAFQITGEGPVSRLFVDVTPDGATRAYCVYDESSLSDTADLKKIFGSSARLMFSVGKIGQEPYQGIVALTGNTLSEAVMSYFKMSEQIETDLILTEHLGKFRCLMIQKMPNQTGVLPDKANDVWETAVVLAHSVTPNELTDLEPKDVLFRLFHAEGLRVFDPKIPSFFCSCRREKMARFLKSIPFDQLLSLEQDGKITTECQFCGESYTFLRDEFK